MILPNSDIYGQLTTELQFLLFSCTFSTTKRIKHMKKRNGLFERLGFEKHKQEQYMKIQSWVFCFNFNKAT